MIAMMPRVESFLEPFFKLWDSTGTVIKQGLRYASMMPLLLLNTNARVTA